MKFKKMVKNKPKQLKPGLWTVAMDDNGEEGGRRVQRGNAQVEACASTWIKERAKRRAKPRIVRMSRSNAKRRRMVAPPGSQVVPYQT